MYDAFGVERSDLIEKGWKGEPGDKRNTKYALTWGAHPIAGIAYTVYRQTDTGRKNRNKSIAEAKRRKGKVRKDWKGEKGDKRNTKYALALGAGDIVGTRLGQHAGAMSAGTTRAKGVKSLTNLFNEYELENGKGNHQRVKAWNKHGAPTIHGGLAGSVAGIATAGGVYYAYRHSPTGIKNRNASIKAKKVSKSDSERKVAAGVGIGSGVASGAFLGNALRHETKSIISSREYDKNKKYVKSKFKGFKGELDSAVARNDIDAIRDIETRVDAAAKPVLRAADKAKKARKAAKASHASFLRNRNVAIPLGVLAGGSAIAANTIPRGKN